MAPRGGRTQQQSVTIAVPRSTAQVMDPERWSKGRAEIAAAALPLFLRYGYHATPVRAIGEAVGVSVGSIFNYFPGKEEILQQVLNDGQARAEKVLQEAQEALSRADSSTDPLDLFLEAYRHYARSIAEVRQFTLLAYQETKSLAPEQRAPLFDRERRIGEMLKRAAEPAIRAGLFSGDAIDLKVHSLMVLTHAWAVRHWALVQYPTFSDYLADLEPIAIAVMKARGLGARSARTVREEGDAPGRTGQTTEARSAKSRRRDGSNARRGEAAEPPVFRPYGRYRKRERI